VITRRDLLAGPLLAHPLLAAAQQAGFPVRQITRGPRFHWFGYYDKLQFDPTSRYVLTNQVAFEGRSPKAGDEIRVGVVDTAQGDAYRELGSTRAWNWQQGCMLQWIPGSRDEVIWNIREENRFASVILNVRTGSRRTVPAPVYCLSPDGRHALYPDFRRLNDTRPGYGYIGISDPRPDVAAPDDAGIWSLDLKTGKSNLILSFSQVAAIPHSFQEAAPKPGAKHWFNHLLFSPTGARFIFLHRWRNPGQTSFNTRLFTASAAGKDLYELDPYGKTSHFIWRDDAHILAWAWTPAGGDKFYLYKDRTREAPIVGDGVMTVNGHCTYLPGNRWILNDTYPDKQRRQNVYLYNVASGKRTELGAFHSPPEYTGEWRCDTHPRFSPDGKSVVIDSPHNGGRQMYLIDIRGVNA
jgi:hypothetical protein